MSDLRDKIIDWLDDNYHFGEAKNLIKDDELSFLDHGILDSLGFVQLCVMLEKTYKIKIDRKSLTRANFDSLGKIVRYVTGHKEYRG